MPEVKTHLIAYNTKGTLRFGMLQWDTYLHCTAHRNQQQLLLTNKVEFLNRVFVLSKNGAYRWSHHLRQSYDIQAAHQFFSQYYLERYAENSDTLQGQLSCS